MKIKELSGSFIYDTLINKSPFFFNDEWYGECSLE